MRVAGFCAQDTGGQNYKICKAVRDFTEHDAWDFRTAPDYLAFPYTFQQPIGGRAKMRADKFLKTIDVAHVHNRIQYMNRWPNVKPAPVVFHFHGRQGKLWREARENTHRAYASVIVSTINLLPLVFDDPDKWLPAPIDVPKIAKLREGYKPGRNLRICQSPTYRDRKNTDILEMVVAGLRHEGYPVELVLIEKTDHAECLRIKATCDVLFDQFALCYGNSGLEAFAMDIPVMCGMSSDTLKMVKDIVGYQPFVYVSPDTLRQEIINLLDDEYRTLWKERGAKYIKEWHDYPVVAKRIAAIYESI